MKSVTSPQAQIDLRAQMEECPPVYVKILGAFNIKGWKNGKKKLTVKELWAYSGVPVETLKLGLKKMDERGWITRTREPGGAYVYEKAIEEMTWDEAHELARFRLTGGLPQQQGLFEASKAKKGEYVPRGTSSKKAVEQPPKGKDSPPPEKTAPEASQPLKPKAPDTPWKALRDHFWTQHEAVVGHKPAFVPSKSLVEQEKAVVEALGLELAKTCVGNYLVDPWIDAKTYLHFLKDAARYKTRRQRDGMVTPPVAKPVCHHPQDKRTVIAEYAFERAIRCGACGTEFKEKKP